MLCGFLMALAVQQRGRHAKRSAGSSATGRPAGRPALFTEEFDVGQRQLRGNLPQAFVHALMFESAAQLAQPWEQR